MVELKRILVPTDFSDYSRHAAKYACVLAQKFDAEVHLVHVMQDLVAMVPEPGLAFPPPGDYMREMQDSAERGLAQFLEPDWHDGDKVVRSVLLGPPYLEIIRYAEENQIDLIVMGTHGRSGLAHMLLGSVTEKVIRKAPCPVMTVRPPDEEKQA